MMQLNSRISLMLPYPIFNIITFFFGYIIIDAGLK